MKLAERSPGQSEESDDHYYRDPHQATFQYEPSRHDFGDVLMENFMNHDSQEFSETVKYTPHKQYENIARPCPLPQVGGSRDNADGVPPPQQMRTIFANYSPIQLTENSNSLDQSASFSHLPDYRPQIPIDLNEEQPTINTIQKPLKKKPGPKEDLIEGIFIIGPEKGDLLPHIVFAKDEESVPE